MLPQVCFAECESACERLGAFRVRKIMASLTLKNVKKIYPHNGDDAKKAKKKKKGDEQPEKKVNLQITEQGVVAVQ